MNWTYVEIGYNFYFQREYLNGVERDRVQRTLDAVKIMDNPIDYSGVITTCPQHNRVVIHVIDSEIMIGMIIHGDDDPRPELQHCIELVKIIDPKEL